MSVDFRIIDFNFPFQSNVALSATSEDTEFPATNVSKFIRGKAWRSSGSFVITTANNKLDFRETNLGPEITATLTIGIFSLSALLVEIKTQMDAETLNARTYTITQSATSGKWTIAGSVFLELLFASGTNVANSIHSDIGFSGVDHTGSTSYVGSTTAIHTEEGLVIDIKTQEAVDTFALVFDPEIGIKFSEQAVLTLQANHANEWSSPPVSIALTVDNTFQIVTHYFTSDQSFRFWRVKIVDPQNANLYVELHKIILGKDVGLTRIPDNGFKINKLDLSVVTTNDFGNQFVDEFPQMRSLEFDMNIVPYAVKTALDEIFRRVGNRTPIFIVLDTLAELFDKNDIAIYGRLGKNSDFDHIVAGNFKTSVIVREAF